MKWFGKSWDAPICGDTEHVDTPTDKLCFCCQEPIAENDQGLIIPYLGKTTDTEEPWHTRCLLLSIVGDFGTGD